VLSFRRKFTTDSLKRRRDVDAPRSVCADPTTHRGLVSPPHRTAWCSHGDHRELTFLDFSFAAIVRVLVAGEIRDIHHVSREKY
jgi:hypothetical protein